MKTLIALLMFTCLAFPLAAFAAETPSNTPDTQPAKTSDDITTPIFGVTSGSTSTRAEVTGEYCGGDAGKYLSDATLVTIVGIKTCTPKYSSTANRYYEIAINGKTYFIDQDMVKMTDADKARLFGMSQENAETFRNTFIAVTAEIRKAQLRRAVAAIDKTAKQGLTVLKSNISDPSEYTEGTGFSVSVFNPTKKTVKYVSFSVIGYNSVKDKVPGAKGKTVITVKGVGPIEPKSSGTYSWEYLWFTDLVQTHKISQIKVEYMDGSKRTIDKVSSITLSRDDISALEEDD